MSFDEFEEACLQAHNEYRRKHGAAPLVLDRQVRKNCLNEMTEY